MYIKAPFQPCNTIPVRFVVPPLTPMIQLMSTAFTKPNNTHANYIKLLSIELYATLIVYMVMGSDIVTRVQS